MTETLDLEDLDLDLGDVGQEMGKVLEERAQAKIYCRKMMVSLEKSRQVIGGQEEEIKSLRKNRDPQLVRALIDMTARAKAEHGMKDIISFMTGFKET